MKRNIVPLLGIAVVVAILSTGVFYGLFAGKLRSASADVPGQPIVIAARDLDRGTVLAASDLKVSRMTETLAGSFSNPQELAGSTLLAPVKANEPLLAERVVPKVASAGSPNGSVPTGMRAVSVRVSESDGLLGLLRPGTKIDLQAVQDRNGGLELRTILQDVEVLSVSAQQPGNRGPVSVVTVLARPEDADILALADSGARMRIALRNPLDSATGPRDAVSLGSVFRTNRAQAAPASRAGGAPAGPSVDLDVQVLRASASAISQLESKLAHAPVQNSLSVTPFAPGSDNHELIQKLLAGQQAELLSEQTLSANSSHAGRFHVGSASGRVGLVIFTETGRDGKRSLRVQPEISAQSSSGLESRILDADIPAGGSFLVTGIARDARDRDMLEHLYPGRAWGDAQLLMLVTSREQTGSELSRVQRGK